MGNVLSKVAWVGRTASMVFGLALVLALLFGVATSAMGANGKPFILGKGNLATKVSTLVKKGPGPALNLVVGAGQPPLAVNSQARVANLNAYQLDGIDSSGFYAAGSKVADSAHADQADVVDGKSANQIGVNGRELVVAGSWDNGHDFSQSSQSVSAYCPAGKMVVGTGFKIGGGKSGTFPNEEIDVAVAEVFVTFSYVSVKAYEEVPTSADWEVEATAICATAP